jgi:hypothetical protein
MNIKNTVKASVEFFYRGELYSAAVTIELDQLIENKTPENAEVLSSLHHLLATKMGIDKYSYQFEMMQAEEICFSEAQGIATQYLQDGHFDIKGFEHAWRENKMLNQLQNIASRLLDVDDLEQRPELKNALLEAYRAGHDTDR